MENNEIWTLISGGIASMIGLIKIEIVKRFVDKITSDKEKVTRNSVVLVALFVISVMGITYYASTSGSHRVIVETIDNPGRTDDAGEPQVAAQKTDAQAGIEAVVDVTKSLIEQKRESNAQKRLEDSVFRANRPQRWVYQIGSETNDEDVIYGIYKRLNVVEGIKLFRYKKTLFLFQEGEPTIESTRDLKDEFRSKIGNTLNVNVIDLMGYCKNAREKIIQTKSEKLGKRKGRVEIECYTVVN